MRSFTLLFADDDDRSLKLLSALFESEGYQTRHARDGQEAFEVMKQTKIDLIISDILMPKVDGYYLCFKIRSDEQLRTTPIIIYSGTFTSAGEEKKAMQMGADLFIRKPAPRDILYSAVQNLLEDGRNSIRPPLSVIPGEIFHQYNAELIRKLEERNQALEDAKANLEHLVLERTKGLDYANEELLAANEELNASNEELTALNDQLNLAATQIAQQSAIIIQQKEEALRQSQQSLNIIFENTNEDILVLDAEGRAIFFNRSLEETMLYATGRRAEKGMFVWDITTPDRAEISRKLFMRVMQGETVEIEVPFPRFDQIRLRLLRYMPVMIEGEVKFVTIIANDITDKKRQEDELRRSESNLRTIFENSTNSFTLLDPGLRVVTFNNVSAANAKEMFGRELCVGDNILEFIPEGGRPDFMGIVNRAEAGEVVRTERFFRFNDIEKWVVHTFNAVRSSDGQLTGYCMSSYDITSTKRAESEILRLNKSLFDFQQAIYRSSIVSIADTKGDITFVNDNFIRISGYSREELLGQNHRIVNSGYHPKSFWSEMWRTISSGKIWREQIRNLKKNGGYYWVDTFIMPFVSDKGEVLQYLSIRNDITSRKLSEEELEQKRVILEEATRVAKIGYWVRDIRTGSLTISKEMLSLLEVSESEYAVNDQVLYSHVHEEDRARLPHMTDLNAAPDGRVHAEYRVITSHKDVRWISQKADFNKVIDGEKKVIGVVQDITERKITEEMLRFYNERFEILSKATNDAIWDFDVTLDIVEWNHAITSTFGYDQATLGYTGQWWESRVHSDDKDRVMKVFGAAIRAKRNTWSATFRYACADGSYKHVFNRSYIIYDADKPVRVIGSLQDISDRVNAMEEVEKLSLVASNTNNGVMITDRNGQIEWVNESFERMTGYSLNEIKGSKSTFLQGEETDKAAIERISDKLRRQEFISEEIVNYTKSGEKFWLKLEIVPVFDERRNLKNFISIQTDITKLKEFQDSITSIARELSSLIENANVPIFGIDNAGLISEWNGVTVSLTGYSKSEAIGKKWDEVIDIQEGAHVFEIITTSAANGIPIGNLELPIRTRDGKRLMLLLSASPRRSVNQQITGVIIVGQNITELTEYRNNLEQKVAERTRELNAALEKEKELVKMKNQFVSIASHEFRTPLTSISIASGFIKKYKDRLSPQEIDDKIASIEKQVQHMTYLLDDILMVGKAEAGRMPVKLKAIEISPFIKSLCDEVRRASGMTHRIELAEDMRYKEIASDEKLLRNIIINLLTNAIKFSPGADRVEVSLRIVNEDLLIGVRDFGIGIPEKDVQNLFEPFYRAGNVQSIQGTGLGLSIIKKATDLLNGSVSISSVVGEGTEIIVKLPV